MLFSSYGFAVLATAFLNIPTVAAVAPTDEYTDADPAQSGYLPNHNMDPVVDSSQFGQLWKIPFNAQQVRTSSLRP
jgi:iron transport multicopper oxidase